MELEEKDLPQIVEKLWKARLKWYYIGLQLKISPDDLEVIERDKINDTDTQFRTMILRWLRGDETCTWEDLCLALSAHSVGFSQLADTLRKEKCPDSTKPEVLQSQVTVTLPSQPQDVSSFHQLSELTTKNPASLTKQLCLKKRVQLREYQMELATPGLQGKNYILVAPTGTGKTLIAGYIIMNHLKQMKEKGKNGKVAFVTPTRQLALQQREQLQKYIQGIMAVDITGASGHPMQPLIQNELVDVIVCTAGKLRQDLKTDGTCIHISKFSLVVVDECHHAGRPSNFTDALEFYIREKHTNPSSSCCLPQVIGMTASPGAGKGKNASLCTALEHQMSLCSTLDATDGIVTVKTNVVQLERFRNDPTSYLEVGDERSPTDPFNVRVNSTMQQLEESIGDVPCMTRSSPQYECWLNNEKEAAENRDENEAMRLTVIDRLLIYMQSLMVYCDFQYNDAMSVLRRIKAFPDQSSFEVELNKTHAVLMRELGDVPVIPNPLLEHMESILINQYSKYPQSRGIFFVRGIRHTRYIVNWIESSPELSPVIKASSITGHHRGGMEKGEQLRVLEAFRNGTYNLLASTSVLEEGLDVPECNYVIRFQNVSNEIAQVQSKGRARADNSRFYTVVSANSNKAYWYLVQEEKQRIVNVAIDALQQRSLCSLQEDISSRQKAIKKIVKQKR